MNINDIKFNKCRMNLIYNEHEERIKALVENISSYSIHIIEIDINNYCYPSQYLRFIIYKLSGYKEIPIVRNHDSNYNEY